MNGHSFLLSCFLLMPTIASTAISRASSNIPKTATVLTCIVLPACANYTFFQWIKEKIDPSETSFLKHTKNLASSIKKSTYINHKRALIPSISTNIVRYIIDNTVSPATTASQALETLSKTTDNYFDNEEEN